jgi:hypothetical protein
MARRSAPPPKPKSPILTVGQKRRRIERLQKCITSLEAFDDQKVRKRAPAVLALEAAIDKALSSAFGYGTTGYLRYDQAAILDPSPLLTRATVRASAPRPVGGPVRHDVKVQQTRQNFLENKERAIALLKDAVSTLEQEIAETEPVVVASRKSTPTPEPDQEGKAQAEGHTPSPRQWGGIGEAVRRRLRRWWRGNEG